MMIDAGERSYLEAIGGKAFARFRKKKQLCGGCPAVREAREVRADGLLFYLVYFVVMATMLYMCACLLWLVSHPPKHTCSARWDVKAQTTVYECTTEVSTPPYSIFGR